MKNNPAAIRENIAEAYFSLKVLRGRQKEGIFNRFWQQFFSIFAVMLSKAYGSFQVVEFPTKA